MTERDPTSDNTLGELLKLATRGGFKSSEFVLALAALILPWVILQLDALKDTLHGNLLVTVGFTVATSMVSAVYTWVAGQRKKAAANAAAAIVNAQAAADSRASVAGTAPGTIPAPTGGNVLLPPGA